MSKGDGEVDKPSSSRSVSQLLQFRKYGSWSTGQKLANRSIKLLANFNANWNCWTGQQIWPVGQLDRSVDKHALVGQQQIVDEWARTGPSHKAQNPNLDA